MTGPDNQPSRASKRALLAIAAFALMVRSGALLLGFTVDDFGQLAMIRGDYPVPRGALDLFTFSDGSEAEVTALTDAGFFPYFRHPDLKLSMLRPLSSALMQFDAWLFGNDALPYHLHSLVWWLAMLGLCAALLQQLLPARLALVAFALLSLDEAHTMALGWIANRNELVSSVFALAALWTHLRTRQAKPPHGGPTALTGAWSTAALFSLALLGGEYSLAFLGYFVAYELLSEKPARARLLGLLPTLLPAMLYLGIRQALGYGSRGSSMYVDPVRETAPFLSAASERLPVMVGDLLLGIGADGYAFGFRWTPQLVQLGWLPQRALHDIAPAQQLQLGAGVLALLLGLGLLAWSLRGRGKADPLGWLTLGAGLSLLPTLVSIPSTRMLIPPLLGLCAALAGLVVRASRGAWPYRILAGLLLGYHLVMPTVNALQETAFGKLAANKVRASMLKAPFDAAKITQQDVFLFGAADLTTTLYIPYVRRLYGLPAPRSCHLVSSTWAPQRLTRTSEHSFELRRLRRGENAGDAYGRVFNNLPVEPGLIGRAGPMRVEVLDSREGRPTRTRHVFDVPLDHPSLLFIVQTGVGLVRLPLPTVGGFVDVPAPTPPLALP